MFRSRRQPLYLAAWISEGKVDSEELMTEEEFFWNQESINPLHDRALRWTLAKNYSQTTPL